MGVSALAAQWPIVAPERTPADDRCAATTAGKRKRAGAKPSGQQNGSWYLRSASIKWSMA